ncbi:hypothetical protein STEG23_018524, partial [Scotinomys teguina]
MVKDGQGNPQEELMTSDSLKSTTEMPHCGKGEQQDLATIKMLTKETIFCFNSSTDFQKKMSSVPNKRCAVLDPRDTIQCKMDTTEKLRPKKTMTGITLACIKQPNVKAYESLYVKVENTNKSSENALLPVFIFPPCEIRWRSRLHPSIIFIAVLYMHYER